MTLPRPVEGEVLKATDYLEGHVNCRCTLVPRAKSYAEVLGDPSIPDNRPPVPNGEREFANLDLNTQARILGPGKYALYRDGAPLDAFVQRVESGAWGASRVARPLKDIMSILQDHGWQPGDLWPTDIGHIFQQGASAFTPRITPMLPEPAPAPYSGPVPGEFKSLDEAQRWWKSEFPDTDLQLPATEADIDMEALNGTLDGFRIAKGSYPEGFDHVKAVNFRDIGNDSTYAHAAGAVKDSAGKWVSNDSGYYPDGNAIIEFNLRPKFYGPKGTLEQPLSPLDRLVFEGQLKAKEWLNPLIAEVDDDWISSPGTDYLFSHTIAPAILRLHPDMGFTLRGLAKDYKDMTKIMDILRKGVARENLNGGARALARLDMSDVRGVFERLRWGSDEVMSEHDRLAVGGWRDLDRLLEWGQPYDIYNRLAATNDLARLGIKPSEMMQWAAKYVKARDELEWGKESVSGLRPLWKSIQSDISSGFHPDVGAMGDTIEEQRRIVASIAVHEYGHVYDLGYLSRLDGVLLPGQMDMKNGWANTMRAVWQAVKDSPMSGGVVSGYARKNANEKFAETFASIVMQPKSKQVAYVRKIEKALKYIRSVKPVAGVPNAPYGNTWAAQHAYWDNVEAMAKANRDIGVKIFKVDADDVRDAPKVIKLLREAEAKGLDDWRTQQMIIRARSRDVWDFEELL